MGWIVSLVAVSTFAGSIDSGGFDPYAIATPVGAHEFGRDCDRDYDGLPDGWTRRSGPGFPQYVEAEVDGYAGHGEGGSLRFAADGAPAVLYGPPVLIDGGQNYLFEAYVRTQRLHAAAAVCSVSILDHRRQRLARHLTAPVSGTHAGWVRVRIGPIAPIKGQRYLVLGCHLVQGADSDLEGEAWFDDLRVGATPVLALTGDDARFRRPAEPTTLVITATGLDREVPYRLLLSLKDVDGKVMDRAERAVSAAPAAPGAESPPAVERWAVPGAQHGFYRFDAELHRGGGAVAQSEATFVVTDAAEVAADSPFGWSVADLPSGMTTEDFALAASEGGISRVKLPLWRGVADRTESARAVDFVERLAQRQVSTVGLLDPPPDDLRRKFSATWTGTGEVFRLQPEVWSPALEAVVARHGARVRHWQLGRDGDRSFSELPDLNGTLAGIRERFDRVGRSTRIGIPWPAGGRPPEVGNGFVSVPVGGQPGDEFYAGVAETWAAVRPSAERGAAEVRAGDLVRRMVEARGAGASAVFATDVLDPDSGLLRADGSPTELYLPWRTAAVTLGRSVDIGPIATPGGSRSRAFESGDSATVVLWSDEPRIEALTPGGSPSIIDIWGRPSGVDVDADTGGCEIPVGPSPVFVTGASAALLRWQMAARFEQPRLRSQHGPQPQAVIGSNPFGQGVSGTVTLVGPAGWEVEPNRWPLRLAAGETFRLPLMLTLPPDASLGSHDFALEFDIQADRPYRFAVHRELAVGLGDIDLEVTETRLPDGRLEIVQTITNRTSPGEVLNFRCDLFVPGVQRQRQYVVKLGPGRDTKRYCLASGDDLAGKELWLRAEQENGRRVLNYRWKVGKDG